MIIYSLIIIKKVVIIYINQHISHKVYLFAQKVGKLIKRNFMLCHFNSKKDFNFNADKNDLFIIKIIYQIIVLIVRPHLH